MNQYTIIRKLEYSELNDKVDEKEYDEKRAKFVPSKELTRVGIDYYDGK